MATAPDFLRGPLFVKRLLPKLGDALTLTLSPWERGFCRIPYCRIPY